MLLNVVKCNIHTFLVKSLLKFELLKCLDFSMSWYSKTLNPT
jgi:hypothetical protein